MESEIKEGDNCKSYSVQVSFDSVEKVQALLAVCETCMKYRNNIILFVNSMTMPYTYNAICEDCIDRLKNKITVSKNETPKKN